MTLFKPKVVLVDCDEVCLSLLDSWLECYNSEFDDDLTSQEITDWDISKFVNPLARERIYEYIQYPHIFDVALPVDGALEGINILKYLGYRIVYVTINNPENIKWHWLKRNGFIEDKKDLIIAEDKSLIMGDYMIDDNPKNIQNTLAKGVLLNAPYNKNAEVPTRVNSWKEFVKLVVRNDGWDEK